MGGSQRTTQSSTYTPNKTAIAGYERLFPQAEAIAGTPWNPATAIQVAGFNPQQMQAFNNIGNLAGGYQPYIDTASQMTQGASAPISNAAISHYMSPYQQDVINATMAQLGQQQGQQLQNLNSSAIAQNALGGNRADIARGYLQGQQNLATGSTLANLNQANYGQALSAAQQDTLRQLSAAQQMAGLGSLGQTLGLQGAQALYGAGATQQQQQQNMLNAAQQNAQAQTMWPYQNLQWLSSIYGGIGPLMGGTTSGSGTTSYQPGLGSMIGAGASLLSGFGMPKADGGRIRRADGGIGAFPTTGGFPWAPVVPGRSIVPQFSAPQAEPKTSAAGNISELMRLGARARSGLSNILDGLGGNNSGLNASSFGRGVAGIGNALSNLGSKVGDILGPGDGISYARGGLVRMAYAGGGNIGDWGDIDWNNPVGPTEYMPPAYMGLGTEGVSWADQILAPLFDDPNRAKNLLGVVPSSMGVTSAPNTVPSGEGPTFSPTNEQGAPSISSGISGLTERPPLMLPPTTEREFNRGALAQAAGNYIPSLQERLDRNQTSAYMPQTTARTWENEPQLDLRPTIVDEPATVAGTMQAPPQPQTVQPSTYADITGPLETNQTDPLRGVGSINYRDTNGRVSYGNFGLNDASAALLQKEHPELGLAGTPGSRQFTDSWLKLAEENPVALHAAELDWHNTHVLGGMSERLQKAGIDPAVADDPRVQAYVADHFVQHGYGESVRNDPRFKSAYEASDKTPEGFLTQLSGMDRANIKHDFQTYLSEHPDHLQGLINRVDKRYAAASGVNGEPANISVASAGREPTVLSSVQRSEVGNGDRYASLRPGKAESPGIADAIADVWNPFRSEASKNLFYAGLGAMADPMIPGRGTLGALQQQQQVGLQQQQLAQQGHHFGVVGYDQNYGFPIYGFQNLLTGEVTVPNLGGVAGNGPVSEGASASGQAYLGSLPSGRAALVKAIGDYKQKFPLNLSRPQVMMLDAQVHSYNPDYDQKLFESRQKTLNSFTSGKDADEVKSYNTVMNHLIGAQAAIGRLGNTQSSLVNVPYNIVRGQTSTQFQESRSTLLAKMDLAMAEVNKAAAGKPITVNERDYWHQRLNQNASPKDLGATLRAFTEMIAGRMDASAEKLNTGMGIKEGDPEYKTGQDLFSKEAKLKYDRLMGTQAAQPATQATRPKYQEGQTATGPNGHKIVFRGGRWQEMAP